MNDEQIVAMIQTIVHLVTEGKVYPSHAKVCNRYKDFLSRAHDESAKRPKDHWMAHVKACRERAG